MKNLKRILPDKVEKIKIYITVDKDFSKLCSDFEEVSEMIQYLEKAEDITYYKIRNQIAKYIRLQEELIIDINSFIMEENDRN